MSGPAGGSKRDLSPILARPWLLLFGPINAATSGFTVILPLLVIFSYHASVLEVALAQSLYSIFLIPGSFVWGHICDRYPKRRPLLLLNYVGAAVIFLGMDLFHGLSTLLLLYSAFGFVAPSGAAASTLLVMERFQPSDRPTAFASFQEITVIGSTLGVLVGFLWLLEEPQGLLGFLTLTFFLAIASAVLLYLLVPEKIVQLSRAQIARNHSALSARILNRVPVFLHLPSRKGLRTFTTWLREEATHEVPLILAAAFLFNLSANLFNTSYTPYLAAIGVGATGVFIVNLSNNSAQVLGLPFSARTASGERAGVTVVAASWLRAGSYGVAALVALLPVAVLANHGVGLGANVVLYGVIGGAFAFYTTASSLLLYRSLEGKSRGTYLGINSAVAGLAAVLGAGLSGLISLRLGYYATFVASMIAMAGAVPVWILARRALARRESDRGSLAPA